MISFTHPWMLAALAAVGLPILIHFLTRARPRRIAFPPFRFLLEACAGQQAVHRLRTWILLALRALAVLALVLLFARPFLQPTGSANANAGARRVVLILDASLSMRAVQRGVPLFSRAQAEAADVLRALESGSEAAVILAGLNPRPLLPALSRNLPALHEELVKAQPTFEQGDPGAALALAAKLLGGVGTIHVFSDFQKSNWDSARQLPGGIHCRLRAVASEPVHNVALTAVRVAPAEPVAGEPAEITCTLFNCTPLPRQETVRLELGGLTQEARVAVPAYGSADASFTLTFPQPGPAHGRAELGPDDLREDNSRHIAVPVGRALKIVLLSDAEQQDQRSAAFFVSRALSPTVATNQSLELIRRHGQDADRGILETADVFLLVAPLTLAGEAVEIVERRVRDGARYLALLDGPTAPLLVPSAFNPPFQLQRSVASETGDPLLVGTRRLFPEGDAADFQALRFHRHYQNSVVAGRAGEILLSFPDGSAAVSLAPVGQGAAAWVNLPLTPDGGDFVGHPMFPALMHELVRALRRGEQGRLLTPGLAWTLDAPTATEDALTVVDPEQKLVNAQVLASGRISRLALPSAHLPGAYLVKQGERLVAAAVVNVDPRESDTRPIALENLQAGTGSRVSVVQDEEDLLLGGRSRPLWPQLAGAAALFLALEMLLLALWRTNVTPVPPSIPIRDSPSAPIPSAPAPPSVPAKRSEVRS